MKNSIQSRAGFFVCLMMIWGVGIPSVIAQSPYPTRPIRILVPFPAGGAADNIGRSIGEKLAAQLGQPVVIDNRSGAAGRIATEMLKNAEPDGHTLLVGGVGPLAISPSLYAKLSYDTQRDFLPVTRVAEILNVLVINPSAKVENVQQFMDWAKKRAGATRFGSSGPGQLDHLAAEFFQRLTGIQLIHVPYKGGGPALIDLLSGDLQLMFATYATARPHVLSGKLRALAVTTTKRQALLPDLPAISETVPGFGVSNWNGVFAPVKTSPQIADRLFVEINRALQEPDVKKRLNASGIDPVGSASPSEFKMFVREDMVRWAKIIKDAGIKLE